MSTSTQIVSSLIISGLITLGIIKWQKNKEKENQEYTRPGGELTGFKNNPPTKLNTRMRSRKIIEDQPYIKKSTVSETKDPIIETIDESDFGATKELDETEDDDEESVDETQTAGDPPLQEPPSMMKLLGIDETKIKQLQDDPQQLCEYLDECILLAVNDPTIDIPMKDIRKFKNDILWREFQENP